MSFKCTSIVASLLGCGVLFAYSFSRPESAMAAEAFAAGDYENSVKLYERVRSAASAAGDEEAWISSTLALARSKVRLGDAAGARKLLDEFLKRHPAHSPGMLPGEILAAEGKISEAEEYFRSFAFSTKDPEERALAELALAYLDLRFGNVSASVEALEKLEHEPRVGAMARLLRIYGLIRARNMDKANELIAGTSVEGRDADRIRLHLLTLLADLCDGRTDRFAAEWDSLRPELKAHPDPLVFDTLDEAAKLALQGNSSKRAAQLWSSAYDFADSDDTRKDVLRKLFNCYAAYDVKMAAATAKRYAEYFPGATDRARLLSGAGRLLVNAGDPKAALDYFELVLDDRELFAVERYDAARDAALAAERAGDPAAARRCYQTMIDSADSPVRQGRAIIAFGEYLLRCRDYAGAERMLRRVAESTVRSIADQAGELLIQALISEKKFSSARAIAERLKSSADAHHAEFGLFHTALLAEKLGESAAARRTYLEFAMKYPKSAFLPEARFSAALIALNAGDYPEAAREFLDYAASYPDGPSRGSAVFWAVRGCCFAGDTAGALDAFGMMKPPEPEYYAAALQLLEALRLAGKAEEGIKFWDSLDRSKCGDNESAALKLERAHLLKACGRSNEAIDVLKDIPDRSPIAADAAFLSGDLLYDLGEYGKALEAFRKAFQLRPSGVFGEVVRGRIGDTLLQQYGSNTDIAGLREAAAIFDELAGKSAVPAIRLQSLHKLGRCRRDLGELRRALSAYEKTLLYARVLKNQGVAFDPRYCYLSVDEALAILEESRLANRRQWGMRIMDSYRKLGLTGAAEDMAKREKEFTERCNMEM